MKHFLLLFSVAFAITCILPACKKNNDSGTTDPNANVLLVNAAPRDTLAHDFYFNDAKLNPQAISYPSNSGYISLAAKNYTIKVAQVNMINTLATGTYNLSGGKSYSVFAYDTLLSGKIKIFAVEDDLSAPATGKAKVRFLHLSPGNIAVDVLANDSLVFANRSYADNVSNSSKSNFISVNAGSYSLKVKLAGTGDAIPPLVTLSNISFAAGKVYTVFAKGTISGTGVNALGAELITNK